MCAQKDDKPSRATEMRRNKYITNTTHIQANTHTAETMDEHKRLQNVGNYTQNKLKRWNRNRQRWYLWDYWNRFPLQTASFFFLSHAQQSTRHDAQNNSTILQIRRAHTKSNIVWDDTMFSYILW